MKKILGLLLVSTSLFSMELALVKSEKKSSKVIINPVLVRAPEKLGNLDLIHGKKGFVVYKDGEKHQVKKYDTDKLLQNINKKQLKSFLQGGYLFINQMDNGDYVLRAKDRLNGGGPMGGVIAYWVTKSICYGVMIASVGTIAVTTGGVAVGAVTGAAATAGATTIGGLAAATTATTAIGTTAGVVTGTVATGATLASSAGVVAGAITTAGGATTAATATGAALATGATAGGVVGGIEALSVTVGTFFGMLPTP